MGEWVLVYGDCGGWVWFVVVVANGALIFGWGIWWWQVGG